MQNNGITAEYIAGFFDGEGSLGFALATGISPWVRVSNNNRHVLELIQAKFPRSGINPNPKTHCASLFISQMEEQHRFLEHILPHLIVKQEQARLVLEYLQLCLNRRSKPFKSQRRRHSQRELEIIREFCERFSRTDTEAYEHVLHRLSSVQKV